MTTAQTRRESDDRALATRYVTAREDAIMGGPSALPPLDEASTARSRKAAGRMHVVRFEDIPLVSLKWLWRGYLPAGKIVVLDGFPGQGKSTVALDLAARLSRGRAMPDGTGAGTPVDTLILTYEDDAGDTLRPRLEAAGGDAHRVYFVEGVSYNSDELLMPPSLPNDLDSLEQVLKEHPEIRLVIIDPLSAALGSEVDSHKDQSVRTVLARIARMASESGACFLIIRHVRKSPGLNAITAGGGSIGISGQARVVLLIDRAPDSIGADANQAVLAVSKSNCGEIPPSLSFRKVSATVTGAGGASVETSRLEWTGAVSMTADELLCARGDSDAASHLEVTDWLRAVLTAATGTDRKDVMRAASASGYSASSVDRAANRLGVIRDQSGFGVARRSCWRLPESTTPAKPRATASIPSIPPSKPVAGLAGMKPLGGNRTASDGVDERPFGCALCDRRFYNDAHGDPCTFCRSAAGAAPAPA